MDKKRIKRGLWAAPCLAAAMGFAAPAHTITIYATTDDNNPATVDNNLISFDSVTPATVTTPVTIGVVTDKVVGIDFRPATNALYAITDADLVYTVDSATGAATVVTATPYTPGSVGVAFGIDFNPVVDRLRVVGASRNNFRLNVDTAAVIDGDAVTGGTQANTDLDYATGDFNDVNVPVVTGAAYTNNDTDVTTVNNNIGFDKSTDTAVDNVAANVA